jgi:chromosome segregation ATPase
MEDEFPIYSLDGGNYARVDDVFENGEAITVGAEESEQATADGQASEAVYMNDAEEEQYENELPSSSQAIYDMNEIDELFTKDESPVSLPADEAAPLPAEVEFTLRTMRNRVTALEQQVNQLTQQVNYEKKEREADNVHWEGLLNTAEATLEKERTSMRNEITELKAKHIEELHAKQALHGKVENIEKVRRDYDDLVLENTKLEAKYAKAAADSQSQKTELAHARSEVNKLKADFTKMKTEYDACRAEIAEKGSENSRLKKEGEMGRGSQEEQLKRLTADKTRLEEQVRAQLDLGFEYIHGAHRTESFAVSRVCLLG